MDNRQLEAVVDERDLGIIIIPSGINNLSTMLKNLQIIQHN